jgi:hypothetical protein
MNFLLSLLHSKSGALVQWLAGALVGWLTSLLVGLGVELPPEQYLKLQESLTVGGAFIVTTIVQFYQSKQSQKVQHVLQTVSDPSLKEDGWIGEKTIEAVNRLLK